VTLAPPPGRPLRAADGAPWWASRARATRRRRKTRPLWCLGPLQKEEPKNKIIIVTNNYNIILIVFMVRIKFVFTVLVAI